MRQSSPRLPEQLELDLTHQRPSLPHDVLDVLSKYISSKRHGFHAEDLQGGSLAGGVPAGSLSKERRGSALSVRA